MNFAAEHVDPATAPASLWLAWLARQVRTTGETERSERLLSLAYAAAGVVYTDDPEAGETADAEDELAYCA